MTDPRAYNLPDRTILSPESVDALGLAVLALTRELWVVKHRQALLEAVLPDAGIDAAARIETMVLDKSDAARLDREGQRLVDSIVTALTGATAAHDHAG